MRLNFAPSLGIVASSYFIYHQYIIRAYHFFRCTIFAATNAVLSIIITRKLSLVLKFSLNRVIDCKTAVFLYSSSPRVEDFELLLLR